MSRDEENKRGEEEWTKKEKRSAAERGDKMREGARQQGRGAIKLV